MMTTEISPARLAALRILKQARESGLPLSEILHGRTADLIGRLAPRDRALTMEIVYGTLRWQGQLDWLLEKVADRSVDRIQSTVLLILRMSLYQIRFLDRVPEPAAVNEAALLARESHLEGLVGFINGVLRGAIRRSTELNEALASAPDWIRQSHPEWLWVRWQKRFGAEAARALAARNNEPPPSTLCCNFRKADARTLVERLRRDDVAVENSRWVDGSFRVVSGDVTSSSAFKNGLAWLQDEGSQLAASLGTLRGVSKIVDLCSAPGGKSFFWARDRAVEVSAFDINVERALAMERRRILYGLDNVAIVAADARQRPPIGFKPDLVFVDAPCSGLGTIRRNPDIRWKIEAADLARFQERQLAILQSAAGVQAPHLIYVTCSTEPEENEQVVESFLASQKHYRRLFPAQAALKRLVDTQGYFRTFPAEDDIDGFFGAVFRLSATF